MTQALLVIDVQNIYTDKSSSLYCVDADQTLAKINSLIEHFAITDQPIIYVRHSHRADGSDKGHMFDFAGPTDAMDFIESTRDVMFSDGLMMLSSAPIISKNRDSSFYNTPLEAILQRMNAERVVICGFMTNFCCESAARDAHDRDFFVDFIGDATGTPGVETMDQDAIRQAVSQM